MNFFVFTVVVLIAIQGAYAIRCHQCRPDLSNTVIALSSGNISAVNLCNNPTDAFNCSQDPDIGSVADACYTATVTMNVSLLNIGELKFHTQNCSVKSFCAALKKTTCDGLKTAFVGISGIGISHCDVSCCEGDLCNNPSGSPATSLSGSPATSPSGSPATSPSASTAISPSGSPATGNPTSSVKSTHILPNAAIFGILGWVTVTFMSLF